MLERKKDHWIYNKKFKDTNNKPVKLVLENDGSIKLYTQANVAVWASNGKLDVTYKIGDMHPDGGIVFRVTNGGKNGTIIKVIDTETFSHDEAKAKVAAMGNGWELPGWEFLQQIYRDVYQKNIVQFDGSQYWSSWRPSNEFAKFVNFKNNGRTSDGPARNKFNICPTKNF